MHWKIHHGIHNSSLLLKDSTRTLLKGLPYKFLVQKNGVIILKKLNLYVTVILIVYLCFCLVWGLVFDCFNLFLIWFCYWFILIASPLSAFIWKRWFPNPNYIPDHKGQKGSWKALWTPHFDGNWNSDLLKSAAITLLRTAFGLTVKALQWRKNIWKWASPSHLLWR